MTILGRLDAVGMDAKMSALSGCADPGTTCARRSISDCSMWLRHDEVANGSVICRGVVDQSRTAIEAPVGVWGVFHRAGAARCVDSRTFARVWLGVVDDRRGPEGLHRVVLSDASERGASGPTRTRGVAWS